MPLVWLFRGHEQSAETESFYHIPGVAGPPPGYGQALNQWSEL